MDGEVPLVQGPSGGAAGDADRSAEETARGVFAAIDAHDLEAIAGFFHPDDVQEFVPIGVFSGRQAVLGVFAELFRAFPDLRMEIEHVMADERGAYVRWRAVGTFSGAPYQGIQPTGRPVEMRGVDGYIEVEHGLIRRNMIFYDGAGFARAVGLLPARGSRLERALLTAFNLRTRLLRLLRRR
jgi:ketosteroid isomerase-like protein